MLSIVKSLKEKIAKSRDSFVGKIADTLSIRTKIDESLMEELEEILLQADVGHDLVFQIINELRDEIRLHSISEADQVKELLLRIISNRLQKDYIDIKPFFETVLHQPHVILIIGVNGTGKTTSIGKIAKQFKEKGKSVLLIAADTFRAAAVEQLSIWADRSEIPIFKKEAGVDPAAVIFDGLNHALAKKNDVVIIDTAGRQHNKESLMKELNKIAKTIQKVISDAPHETLLVLDSTTGQNAILQAKFFHEVTPITGIILTKYDGTAKGGIIIAIKHQLSFPVKLIGVGENIDDLQEFDVDKFSQALFN